ncbi:MAG: hypothetical protein GY941_10800 [Planctomycetes bacterium]|nr:hypothetical protein [Planctomycetota bacterium]
MKDKIRDKIVWTGNHLLVDRVYLGCINSHGINNWQLWFGFKEEIFSTKEQAKEAAEQAVIDWFERVLK